MLKKSFTTIVLVVTLWGMSYFIHPSFAAAFLVIMTLYVTLFRFPLHLGWRKLRKKRIQVKKDLINYIPKILFESAIIIAAIVLFFVYHHDLRPAKLPTHTLSNGEQMIIFQGMSHIASEGFYSEVQNKIEAAKNDGYVLYFEGVKGGTKENQERLNQLLGVQIDATFYDFMADIYGLHFQSEYTFTNIVNSEDFNIDLSIDELIELHENSEAPEAANIGALTAQVLDIDTLSTYFNMLDEKQKSFIRYINQSMFNLLLKSQQLQDLSLGQAGRFLQDIVLVKRNEYVVEAIQDNGHEKIFITYGLLHFQGIFDELKAADDRWEIIETTYTRPIQ